MRLTKYAVAGATAVSMLMATAAVAATPMRASQAMPALQHQPLPVNGVRSAAPLKRASYQSDGGTPVLGYVLAGVFAAGLVAATITATDDGSDSTPPSSPG